MITITTTKEPDLRDEPSVLNVETVPTIGGNVKHVIEIPITTELLQDYNAYHQPNKGELLDYLNDEVEKAFDEILEKKFEDRS